MLQLITSFDTEDVQLLRQVGPIQASAGHTLHADLQMNMCMHFDFSLAVICGKQHLQAESYRPRSYAANIWLDTDII